MPLHVPASQCVAYVSGQRYNRYPLDVTPHSAPSAAWMIAARVRRFETSRVSRRREALVLRHGFDRRILDA